jgi:hypothetical protein
VCVQVPLLFWFDKTHICSTEHYRRFLCGTDRAAFTPAIKLPSCVCHSSSLCPTRHFAASLHACGASCLPMCTGTALVSPRQARRLYRGYPRSTSACRDQAHVPHYRPIPLTGRSHLPADPTNRPIPCTTCGDRPPAPVRTSSGPRVRCKLLCVRRARPRVQRLRSCARVRTSCARASECGPEYTRSVRCSAVLADA